MNAYEYLSALRSALSVLPEDEINSAMRYYEDYFLDAGDENAERVIAELGDPQKVAQDILKEYGGMARAPRHAEDAAGADGTAAEFVKQQKARVKGINPWVLAVLVLLAVPIGVPLLAAAFGVGASLLAAFVCVVLAVAIVVVVVPCALGAAGVALCIFAFFVLFHPASALLTFGVGLVLLSGGVLCAALMIKLCILFIPPIIRGIVALLRWPIDKIRGAKR